MIRAIARLNFVGKTVILKPMIVIVFMEFIDEENLAVHNGNVIFTGILNN